MNFGFPGKPVDPEPASTVVLLREGRNCMEVYLTRRQGRLGFLGGYHVFPGGKLDDHDSEQGTLERCAESAAGGGKFRIPGETSDNDALAFTVAAIRELFEEAGVLLAYDESGRLLNGDDEELWQTLRQSRQKIHHHEIRMTEMMEKAGLTYALDQLVWFANWVTPASSPRRFNTHFFLARLPDGQNPSPYKEEVSASEWIEPAAAIEKWRRGEIKIIPPTLASLDALVGYKSWEKIKKELGCKNP